MRTISTTYNVSTAADPARTATKKSIESLV